MTLEDWDRIGRDTPTLVDLMPSGRFLMEDYCYAGGLPIVIKALSERQMLHDNALIALGAAILQNEHRVLVDLKIRIGYPFAIMLNRLEDGPRCHRPCRSCVR
jgi:dihydroxyacid dehydratase/phosphogluconate dehydratase